jgi:hypothetical protein
VNSGEECAAESHPSGKRAKVLVELVRSGEDWRIAELVWESGSRRELYRRKAMRDAESNPR